MKLGRIVLVFALVILLLLPGCRTKELKEITLCEVTLHFLCTTVYSDQ